MLVFELLSGGGCKGLREIDSVLLLRIMLPHCGWHALRQLQWQWGGVFGLPQMIELNLEINWLEGQLPDPLCGPDTKLEVGTRVWCMCIVLI